MWIPSSACLGLWSSLCPLCCLHSESSTAVTSRAVWLFLFVCFLFFLTCFSQSGFVHSTYVFTITTVHVLDWLTSSPDDGIMGRAWASWTRYFQDLHHTELGNTVVESFPFATRVHTFLMLCWWICTKWNNIRTRLVRQRSSVCFL